MSLILVSSTSFWVKLATVGMCLICCKLRHLYVSTARCLRRIEALGMLILNVFIVGVFFLQIKTNAISFFESGRSALISHTNATINGLCTIRATNSKQILINEFHDLLNRNTNVSYMFKASTRAVSFWLELICLFYLAIAIGIFLFCHNRNHFIFLFVFKLYNFREVKQSIIICLFLFSPVQRSAAEMLDLP